MAQCSGLALNETLGDVEIWHVTMYIYCAAMPLQQCISPEHRTNAGTHVDIVEHFLIVHSLVTLASLLCSYALLTYPESW